MIRRTEIPYQISFWMGIRYPPRITQYSAHNIIVLSFCSFSSPLVTQVVNVCNASPTLLLCFAST